MLIGAKCALRRVFEARGLFAGRQRARPFVDGDKIPAGAVGADEPLDEGFTNLLGHLDAFTVEPVVAKFTANHPTMVVRASAQAVRSAI